MLLTVVFVGAWIYVVPGDGRARRLAATTGWQYRHSDEVKAESRDRGPATGTHQVCLMSDHAGGCCAGLRARGAAQCAAQRVSTAPRIKLGQLGG